MKKPIILYFILYIWIYALSSCSALRADGIDVERATGKCYSHDYLSKVDFNEYDKIWIDPTLDYKYSLDKDKAGVDQDSDWLKQNWHFHSIYRNAIELCATGDVESCNDIVEHTKFLAENKKMFKNKYFDTHGHDYYESTLFNNFSIAHVLTAYGVAIQKVEVDADTHDKIGKQFKKAIKSNNRLKNDGQKYVNNHHLVSARSFALYGTIFDDAKAIKKAKSLLNRYYKTMTKEGALKYEAVRGHRALFYTGKTITAVISILNILEDGGEQAWTDREIEWVAKAVEFYIDASEDNMKIYKWAKQKKHNKKGDAKIQQMTHNQKGWVRPFVQRYTATHPELVEKVLGQYHVGLYLQNDTRKNGDQWILVDTKCFYNIGEK